MRLPGICLIIIILASAYGITKIQSLQDRLDTLERTLLINQASDFKQQLLDRYITPQESSILELRCQNDKEKWIAGGALLSKWRFTTTTHLLKPKSVCKIYSLNKLIGTFSEENRWHQIGTQDLVIAFMNPENPDLPIKELSPKISHAMSTGDLVIMIAYLNSPKHLIHFGMVLSPENPAVLENEKWTNALITNDSPTPVPIGSPFFAPDGDFVGIYLGKEKELLYHALFNLEFWFYYQITTYL